MSKKIPTHHNNEYIEVTGSTVALKNIIGIMQKEFQRNQIAGIQMADRDTLVLTGSGGGALGTIAINSLEGPRIVEQLRKALAGG